MQLLFGCDDAVAEFVGQKLSVIIHPPFTALGLMHENAFAGGIVFNNFNHSNVDLTVCTERPVTRGVIRAVAHYAFVQLGCNRISATTRRNNDAALKALPKLGFKFEAVRKQWFGAARADDGVTYVLTRKAALEKWMQ